MREAPILTHVAALAAGAMLLIAAAPVGDQRSFGIWSNPSGSVHVRAEPCGKRICGVVIQASDKAKADAARGGTPHLIGQRLFRDFQPAGEGVWRGKVFVPDIAKTFSGLEEVLAAELTELGAEEVQAGRRMVSFRGDQRLLWNAILNWEAILARRAADD